MTIQEGAAKKPSKSSIVKLAIPVLIALVALLVFNFQSIMAYQKMSQDITDSMFQDPATSAVLLTYRDNQDVKELTVNVKGITGELAAYRPDVIKFVCTTPFLKRVLELNHRVDIKITASLRKEDKYLNISVTQELCLGLN